MLDMITDEQKKYPIILIHVMIKKGNSLSTKENYHGKKQLYYTTPS